VSLSRFLPTKRVIAAAVRLAGVYAVGVTVLLLALMISTDRPSAILADLRVLGFPAAICFAASFLLLGVARRAGFLALWVLISGFLWAWPTFLFRGHLGPPTAEAFVLWSIFAAPLYAMVSIGFSSTTAPTASSRSRSWVSFAIAVVWLSLASWGVRYGKLYEWLPRPGPWLRLFSIPWLVVPPALTFRSILHLTRRAELQPTAPLEAPEPA
jgi:hypothetical protein